MSAEFRLELGRSTCADLAAAERREWLVTNGLGGFASGTLAGSLTRRYHGLLFAALNPPLGRTLLVSKCDETVLYGGSQYALGTNRWSGGIVDPNGSIFIERFRLEGMAPVWYYELGEALLEKRIWMEYGSNATYVRYAHLRGSLPITLNLRLLVNYRDFHATTHAGDWRMDVTLEAGGFRVVAFEGARPFYVSADGGAFTICNEWFRDFELAQEAARGLDYLEDHLCAATHEVILQPGETLCLRAADCDLATIEAESSMQRRRVRKATLLATWQRAQPAAQDAPGWLRQCVLAADQFIVARPRRDDAGGKSVIAGYPWFGDWGRDTMIALKGLTLATGRFDVAANLLAAYAELVDGGMLPNFFPESGSLPEYNTVDASLWFVEATAAYVDATGDLDTLRRIFAALEDVVRCYRDGTRYGIHVDPADGLVVAGESGVQLTWMDARVGDRVITPRAGKPVEIAALWYNALERLVRLAPKIGRDPQPFELAARSARLGFARYWNAERGYCFDVLDGPDGNDPSCRPNQLFAVSLPFSPLEPERQRAVVTACGLRLFAGTGMRSLAPDDARYVGRYVGSPETRDASYHQGVAWLWLLGAYVDAYARICGDAAQARRFLDAYVDALQDGGLGTLGEITDGDAPFLPRGAIAQAWSVAEALRAWHDAPAFAAGRWDAPEF